MASLFVSAPEDTKVWIPWDPTRAAFTTEGDHACAPGGLSRNMSRVPVYSALQPVFGTTLDVYTVWRIPGMTGSSGHGLPPFPVHPTCGLFRHF